MDSFSAILVAVSMLTFAGVAVSRFRFAVKKEAWLKKGGAALRAALGLRALRAAFLPDERGCLPEGPRERLLALYGRTVLTALAAAMALALACCIAAACRPPCAPFALAASAVVAFKAGGAAASLLEGWAQAEEAVLVAVTSCKEGCLDARERRFAAFLAMSAVVLFSCPAMPEGIRPVAAPLIILVLVAALFAADGMARPDASASTHPEAPQERPRPGRAPAWLLDVVAEICEKSGMEDVSVEMSPGFECECEEGGPGEKPVLRVGREFVRGFGSGRPARFAIAHEIAHLSARDHRRALRARAVVAMADFTLVVGCLACAGAAAVGSLQQHDARLVDLALVLATSGAAFMSVGSVACNKRYWQGIVELRADRRALEASGCSVKDVARVLGCDKARDAERDFKTRLEEGGPTTARLKKRRLSEAYLPVDYRIAFVGRPWGAMSYVRHFLAVKSWMLQGKGWAGL